MDLLFKRYASPFSFIDGMIQTGRFSEFVDSLTETVNKEKESQHNWEYFLHKVWEGSFDDFNAEIETNKRNQKMSKRTIETTVNESMKILKNFKPEKG
jgi:hypothetical protein